jgi:hypothetical protein
MKHFFESILIFSLLIFCACTNQEEMQLAVDSDCKQYVDLNFPNYDSLKTDPITVIDAQVEGDCLKLTLQYGGGCKEHKVHLALIHPWCGTPPLPPPTFEIRHDSNDDKCKALITEDYSFNISGIREQGKASVDFILSAKNSSGILSGKTYTYSY